MGQGSRLIGPGPSRIAESVVAIFVPPICREEVLGDLHERFRSPLQYAMDALRTIPLVILSRMRRTADPQLLLIEASILYLSLLADAWLTGGAILREEGGLLRLAIPACTATLGLLVDDTYAKSDRRSAVQLVRGPIVGLMLTMAAQELLRIGNSSLALTRSLVFYGCAIGALLACAVRMSLQPASNGLQGAGGPVQWLNRPSGDHAKGNSDPGVSKQAFIVLAIVIAGILVAFLFAYQRFI